MLVSIVFREAHMYYSATDKLARRYRRPSRRRLSKTSPAAQYIWASKTVKQPKALQNGPLLVNLDECEGSLYRHMVPHSFLTPRNSHMTSLRQSLRSKLDRPKSDILSPPRWPGHPARASQFCPLLCQRAVTCAH